MEILRSDKLASLTILGTALSNKIHAQYVNQDNVEKTEWGLMLPPPLYEMVRHEYEDAIKEDNERVCKLITSAQKHLSEEIETEKANLDAVDRCIDLLPGDAYADNSRVYIMAHINYRRMRAKETELELISVPSLTESQFKQLTGDDLPF